MAGGSPTYAHVPSVAPVEPVGADTGEVPFQVQALRVRLQAEKTVDAQPALVHICKCKWPPVSTKLRFTKPPPNYWYWQIGVMWWCAVWLVSLSALTGMETVHTSYLYSSLSGSVRSRVDTCSRLQRPYGPDTMTGWCWSSAHVPRRRLADIRSLPAY